MVIALDVHENERFAVKFLNIPPSHKKTTPAVDKFNQKVHNLSCITHSGLKLCRLRYFSRYWIKSSQWLEWRTELAQSL